MGEFGQQHLHPGVLIQGLVVGHRAGPGQQLGHDSGMDVGVLAQVDGQEVETEGLHRQDQPLQPRPDHALAPMGLDGLGYGAQVGDEGLGIIIGLGLRGGQREGHWLAGELLGHRA